jgi:hypothetical protein
MATQRPMPPYPVGGAAAALQIVSPALDGPHINTAMRSQISRQQMPEVVSLHASTTSGFAVDRQLLEMQEDHHQVLDSMAAELEEVEVKLDAKTRELSQAHNENSAWQDFAWRLKQDLERQKTSTASQVLGARRPYGEQERATIHADLQQLIDALRVMQDQVDITATEGKAINDTLAAQAQKVAALQNELSVAQRGLATQQQQRALSDQTNDLRRRCDFFKRNSEKLSDQVRDLSTVNEGMKDEARAKDAKIRELQTLLSSLGYQ